MASLVALFTIIGAFCHGIEAFAMEDGRNQGQKNGTLGLSTILYGPINQQLGNENQAAELAQNSGETAASGAPIIYGPTTSQNNNRYTTIGQDGHVYLLVPVINEPLSVPIPGRSITQNAGTGSLNLDSNDPTGTRIEKIINAFNALQQSFDHIVRLASPFLTQNEISLLQRKSAEDDFTRQTKEIKWLTTVASHRMKLVKLYEQISFIGNYLKNNLEISHDEIATARSKVKDLGHSEARLKKRTEDLVVCVLSKLFLQ